MRKLAAVAGLIATLVTTGVQAQPAASNAPPVINNAPSVASNIPVAGSNPPAVANNAPPVASGSAALPAGHPPVGDLPPGHPTVDSQSSHGGGANRFQMPLVSQAEVDPTLPLGTIEIVLNDGEGKGLAGRDVYLGIVENSVAKGESRQKKTARTDEQGRARFSGLDTGSTFAYRASTIQDGATYAAPPFNFSQSGGMRASLYVYPVTRDVAQASIAAQSIMYMELRDEVIQIEVAYRIYNLGKTTWFVPDVQLSLPEGFKAFNGQRAMSDIGWDGTPQGARFRGTLTPGIHETSFRFQVPYPEQGEARLHLGLLPHVQAMRVISDAPRGMELDVDGFPRSEESANKNGQRILVTEKELPKMDPNFRQIQVHISGLPMKPHGRWYALALAIGTIAIGLVYAKQSKQEKVQVEQERTLARERILDELEKLEKEHASGEVGPRTYEAARRTMMDALARLVQTTQEKGVNKDPVQIP